MRASDSGVRLRPGQVKRSIPSRPFLRRLALLRRIRDIVRQRPLTPIFAQLADRIPGRSRGLRASLCNIRIGDHRADDRLDDVDATSLESASVTSIWATGTDWQRSTQTTGYLAREPGRRRDAGQHGRIHALRGRHARRVGLEPALLCKPVRTVRSTGSWHVISHRWKPGWRAPRHASNSSRVSCPRHGRIIAARARSQDPRRNRRQPERRGLLSIIDNMIEPRTWTNGARGTATDTLAASIETARDAIVAHQAWLEEELAAARGRRFPDRRGAL